MNTRRAQGIKGAPGEQDVDLELGDNITRVSNGHLVRSVSSVNSPAADGEHHYTIDVVQRESPKETSEGGHYNNRLSGAKESGGESGSEDEEGVTVDVIGVEHEHGKPVGADVRVKERPSPKMESVAAPSSTSLDRIRKDVRIDIKDGDSSGGARTPQSPIATSSALSDDEEKQIRFAQ